MDLLEQVNIVVSKAVDTMISELGGEEEVFTTPVRHMIDKEFRCIIHKKLQTFMESRP